MGDVIQVILSGHQVDSFLRMAICAADVDAIHGEY